jgi:hypothetical protein
MSDQTIVIDIASSPLVAGEWVDISAGNAVGMITNRSDTTVIFQVSPTKPVTNTDIGHRMEPGENTTFSIKSDTTFWTRPLTNSGPVKLAVTYGATLAGVPIAPSSVEAIHADIAGRVALNTIFGEIRTAEQLDDVSVNFHYGLSTFQLRTTLSTGTGSVGTVGSDALIECGAGVGTGLLESLDAVRYRAGHETLCHFTHNQSELQDGVDVQHGLINAEDALAIGSQGTTPGLWFTEGGNENFIPNTTGAPIDPDDNLTQFNVDPLDGTGPSGFTLDLTKRNLFAIAMGYLSIAPIYFMIMAGKKGWVPFHVLDFTNQQAEGHLKNPNLPVAAKVRRVSGSGTSVTIETGSWRAGVAGGDRIEPGADRWFSVEDARVNLASVNIVTDPFLYQNMFTIRNKTSFASKINHIRLEVSIVNFVTDGNKGVEFVGILNGTLAGNDAFVDVNTANSVVDISINGTVDDVKAGPRTILGRIDNRRSDVRNTGIFIRPGQTFTLGARGLDGVAVTGDIAASFRWREEF